MAFAQPAGEPDLQLRGPAATATAAATSAPAASAASGDADVPGRLGDPGDGCVSAAAAAAAAAAARARARVSGEASARLTVRKQETPARRFASGPVFFWRAMQCRLGIGMSRTTAHSAPPQAII